MAQGRPSEPLMHRFNERGSKDGLVPDRFADVVGNRHTNDAPGLAADGAKLNKTMLNDIARPQANANVLVMENVQAHLQTHTRKNGPPAATANRSIESTSQCRSPGSVVY